MNLMYLIVDEEAIMLINVMTESDAEERRLMSTAAEDVLASLLSSPVGTQANDTHSHVCM